MFFWIKMLWCIYTFLLIFFISVWSCWFERLLRYRQPSKNQIAEVIQIWQQKLTQCGQSQTKSDPDNVAEIHNSIHTNVVFIGQIAPSKKIN